jgi:radical SAM protein with 4Fe4S-binding SPASM domain
MSTAASAPSEIRRQPTLVVELTARCNHDCQHCYNAWKNEAPYPAGGELDTADTLGLLAKLVGETSARRVSLTGGEPLLRADVPEIVDFLTGRGVSVQLITNGTLLAPPVLARLGGHRIELFELPLLSSEAAMHDELSQAPGAYGRVTRAIAELKLAGERVVVVFVATRRNVRDLEGVLALAYALGVDGVMLNRFNPGGRGGRHMDELLPSPAELRAALDVANALAPRYRLPVSCSIPMPRCLFDHARWPAVGFGVCGLGTAEAYPTVDPLGNLRPCNHSRTILGNVRHDSFWALLDGPTMRAYLGAHPAFCRDCSELGRCQGCCKAAAEACAGSPLECDPWLAAFQHEARKLGW